MSPASTVYVVRVPGRRLFLRWEEERSGMCLVERADGTGGCEEVTIPEGPAFGRLITYTRADAEALLERAKASGQLADLVGRCVIEPHAPEAG